MVEYMKFSELSFYLERLEKTSSRIEITKILAELFEKADSGEIDKIAYLILGKLAPSYESVVFNVADRLMIDVLAKVYKVEKSKVLKEYKSKGDIGDTAFFLAQNSQPKTQTSQLSVNGVYEKLHDLAVDEGGGSVERKIDSLAALLSKLDPLSARYLARVPVGRLRLGFSDKTIIDALSWMESGGKSKSVAINKAYEVVPDVGKLAKKIKVEGIDKGTKNIKPIVGVPVLPMLAQRIKSPAEMIEKMGKVFVEPKFDGLRVLIHFKKAKKGEAVWAFTRNLNNVIDMFPELVDIGKYFNAKDLIIDAEAVGMDPTMQKYADFQTTMQRRRKHDIAGKAKEIPLRFQVFDVIYKDGESLLDTPYYKRREILLKTIKKNGFFVVDEAVVTESHEDITILHKEMISKGLEGVIVKKYDTSYIPGRTGWRWVKMKEAETALGKLSDTVDCVVMGYTQGRGKRVGFGIGQFLAGIRVGEKVKTITKVGTGLTDEQFREMSKRLKKLAVKEMPKEYEVHKDLYPDYWVTPSLVVELAADEITKSPKHTSGFALRFPRLVKFRDDKSSLEATSVSEAKKLFKIQSN